jgi:hypothetical protein
MPKRLAAIGAIGFLLAVAAPAHAQTPSVEDELLVLVNSARSRPVVMHAGLRQVARNHSAAMAVADSLSHRRAKARIDAAEPDPPEAHGAPDDGFTNSWCEVVGWEPAGADAGVAQRFFEDWRASAEDDACMTNSAMTVAGIGVYERGNRWWATLEMEDDRTPPGEFAAVPASTPHSARTTTRTAAPAAASRPASNLTAARSTAAQAGSEFDWRELAVAVAGFCVVPILYTIRRRRLARR